MIEKINHETHQHTKTEIRKRYLRVKPSCQIIYVFLNIVQFFRVVFMPVPGGSSRKLGQPRSVSQL